MFQRKATGNIRRAITWKFREKKHCRMAHLSTEPKSNQICSVAKKSDQNEAINRWTEMHFTVQGLTPPQQQTDVLVFLMQMMYGSMLCNVHM